MTQLFINDEYLSDERFIGTKDEFREALRDIAPEWYQQEEAPRLGYSQWLEQLLEQHLTPLSESEVGEFEMKSPIRRITA